MRPLSSFFLHNFLLSSWVSLTVLSQSFPFSSSNVRTIDGSDRPDSLGKAHENLARIVAAHYPDGVGTTMESTYNPRSISNLISTQSTQILNDRSLSAFVWQFGQLVDHDIGITEGVSGDAANVPCNDGISDVFVAAGCSEIGFDRSHSSGSPREQVRASYCTVLVVISSLLIF